MFLLLDELSVVDCAMCMMMVIKEDCLDLGLQDLVLIIILLVLINCILIDIVSSDIERRIGTSRTSFKQLGWRCYRDSLWLLLSPLRFLVFGALFDSIALFGLLWSDLGEDLINF